MIWPRKRNNRDAEIALDEARRNLDRIQKRTPEVKAVVEASRNLLERNHFVERLEQIMGG